MTPARVIVHMFYFWFFFTKNSCNMILEWLYSARWMSMINTMECGWSFTLESSTNQELLYTLHYLTLFSISKVTDPTLNGTIKLLFSYSIFFMEILNMMSRINWLEWKFLVLSVLVHVKSWWSTWSVTMAIINFLTDFSPLVQEYWLKYEREYEA